VLVLSLVPLTRFNLLTMSFNDENLTLSAHERNANRYRKLYEAYMTSISQPLAHSQSVRHHALAVERIEPPFDFPLSSHAADKVYYALAHAWADSTIWKYTSGVRQFHVFCDRERVPFKFRLPASEFLLCSFAASDAGVLSGNTAQNRISAVRAWHIASNVQWYGSIRLNYVLNGVENLTPAQSCKPPRPPITRVMLEMLETHLSHTDTLDVSVLAAAKTAFWGQCRLAEILSPTATKLPPTSKVLVTLRSHLRPPCTSSGSRMLHLAQTKTKGRKGEDIIICRQYGASDPIEAIRLHLAINVCGDDLPIFSYITASGVRFLTRAKLLERCNRVWALNGMPSSSGHSFRVGGMTELLILRVPPDVVKTMGRWSSDSFLRYWRSLEIVVPLHAELLRPSVSQHI
jgi:hypothetical protein